MVTEYFCYHNFPIYWNLVTPKYNFNSEDLWASSVSSFQIFVALTASKALQPYPICPPCRGLKVCTQWVLFSECYKWKKIFSIKEWIREAQEKNQLILYCVWYFTSESCKSTTFLSLLYKRHFFWVPWLNKSDIGNSKWSLGYWWIHHWQRSQTDLTIFQV